MDHSIPESSQKLDKKCHSISASHAESETPGHLQVRKDDILAKNMFALEERFKCCIPQGQPELEGLTGERIVDYAKVGELMDRMVFHKQRLHDAMRDFARVTEDYPVRVSFEDVVAGTDHEITDRHDMEDKE